MFVHFQSISEEPVITLEARPREGRPLTRSIWFDDLRSADVGAQWSVFAHRDDDKVSRETATVVYRSENGVCVVVESFHQYADEPLRSITMYWVAFKAAQE